MRHLICLLFCLFVGIGSVQANLWLEPSLGYSIGSVDTKNTVAGKKIELKYAAPTYGIKAAYKLLGFMAGIDYNRSSFELKLDSGSSSSNLGDYDGSNLGIFAGFEFPILFKVWASLYLDSEWEHSNTSKIEGDGYALGVGFSPIPVPLPFASLYFNFEYRKLSFDEQTSTTGTTSKLNPNWDVKEYILSISIPFDI